MSKGDVVATWSLRLPLDVKQAWNQRSVLSLLGPSTTQIQASVINIEYLMESPRLLPT